MVNYWPLWFIEAPILKEAWDMTFLAVHIISLFCGSFLAPSKTSRSPSFLKLVLPGNTEIVFCLSLLAVYQDICQGI
jgi:hypothetical protein